MDYVESNYRIVWQTKRRVLTENYEISILSFNMYLFKVIALVPRLYYGLSYSQESTANDRINISSYKIMNFMRSI